MAQSSKFSPPDGGGALIKRKAIADLLERSGPRKLVLIRAPAGFGKTTALRQIAEHMDQAGVATAWITMDSSDNDLPRLLGCLAEAIARLQIDDQVSIASNADALALLAREGPAFALFLDEFEMLRSPAAVGVVREIIEHLPRGGQLVLASRSLPDLGLGRLRVRGQLLEIGPELLRFNLEEISEFLAVRSVPALTPSELELLQARTEGWVAALVLASMAMERSGRPLALIDRMSAAGGVIGEYLAEDVLAGQPEDVREFLLCTSVLQEMIPSLCRELLPDVDSQAMLERLNASGLFISKLDSTAPEAVYRFHRLFSSFLQTQLARHRPEEVARLHLRASGWYERADRHAPSIDHAIAARDFERAVQLLTLHGQQFLERGRMRLLERWFAEIPGHVLDTSPLLQVMHIWSVLFTQGASKALEHFNGSRIAGSSDPVIRAHADALYPLVLAMMDQYDEAYEEGRTRLSRLPTPVSFADAVLINCMAHVTAVMGEQREAQRLLDLARRRQGGSEFNRMYSESTEGVFDKEHGRLRQAMARFRVALESTSPESDCNHTNGNAWAGVLYASTLYEANDLDAVERLLHVYLPLASDIGLPDHMISSHVMRVHILFWRGDVDQAFRVLTELEALGHERGLARVVATARLQRARLMILQDNPQGSREEMERGDDPRVWQRVERQRLPAHDLLDIKLARLRWDTHFGDAQTAVRAIDSELSQLHQESRVRRIRKISVLKCIALWRLGQHDAAQSVMRALLAEGCREGYMRLILDEGTRSVPIIRAVQHAVQSAEGADPFLMEYIARVLSAFGPHASTPDASSSEPRDLPAHMEPLSQKELRILKLVAEGYSNSAIAEKLIVSDSTVRTHLRNVNMKLCALNRTQAVSLARRHGMLP